MKYYLVITGEDESACFADGQKAFDLWRERTEEREHLLGLARHLLQLNGGKPAFPPSLPEELPVRDMASLRSAVQAQPPSIWEMRGEAQRAQAKNHQPLPCGDKVVAEICDPPHWRKEDIVRHYVVVTSKQGYREFTVWEEALACWRNPPATCRIQPVVWQVCRKGCWPSFNGVMHHRPIAAIARIYDPELWQ